MKKLRKQMTLRKGVPRFVIVGLSSIFKEDTATSCTSFIVQDSLYIPIAFLLLTLFFLLISVA